MSKRLMSLALATVLLSGCSWNWSVAARSQGPEAGPPPRETHGDHRGRKTPSYAALHIPPGHLPPPGQCRVWFPDTPPGHQPPPGDCNELAGQVPPGAWLITRGAKKSKEFDVAVYDSVLEGHVLEVRIYRTTDGTFLGFRD